MQITYVKIEDYLGISYQEIDNLGKAKVISVEGGNGAGKSSILKAITEAFVSSGHDTTLIRNDQDKAQILVRLDDDVEINRIITSTANRVVVKVKGEPIPKAQSYLNDLFGATSFNPVSFIAAKADERRTMLLSAMPVDVCEEDLIDFLDGVEGLLDLGKFNYSKHGLIVLQEIRDHVYEERKVFKKNLAQIEGSLKQERSELPADFDVEKLNNFDYKAAEAKIEEANKAHSDYMLLVNKAEHVRENISALVLQAQSIEAQVQELLNKKKEIDSSIDEESERLKKMEAESKEYQPVDTVSIKEELAEYNAAQRLLGKAEDISKREAKLEEYRKDIGKFNRLCKLFEKDIPKAVLSATKLPVDGLEIRDNDIFVNNVAIDKLSTSEQVRFALKVARLLSDKRELKVILVDGFEALDDETRAAFEAEVKDDEFEYFITRVTSGKLDIKTSK